MTSARPTILLALALASTTVACAGAPAAPFDQMKTAQVVAFRLQNYEPPPQVAQPAQPQTPQLIPGLPPEIQKWISAGASMLPPGLLPPGLLGGATAQPAQPVVDNTPRFHGFRILGQVPVADQAVREEIGQILGIEKSFDQTFSPCSYAEFGYSIQSGPNQPPADVLVSLSCDKVIATNFNWPFKNAGLTPDAVQRITKVSKTIFGG